jgi:hypothetical protein
VCLRLVRVRDLAGIRELFERQGVVADEFELARLVRFDLRTQIVICATALIGLAETVVGIGAIELDGVAAREPTLLVVDGQATEGLEQLLADALVGRAAALTRARAA